MTSRPRGGSRISPTRLRSAEHVTALRKRVGEMREPPLGLEVMPDANLEIFFEEILSAPTTSELVCGLYEKALPAMREALQTHVRDTNPLADQPSVRLCRFALLEVEDMIAFGSQALISLLDSATRAKMTDWLGVLDHALAAAGGL